MQIARLENPQNPEVGGILCIFNPTLQKTATWQSKTPIADTLQLAKDCAKQLLHQLLQSGHVAEADFTNWTSAVAGIQHHIKTWNKALAFHQMRSATEIH